MLPSSPSPAIAASSAGAGARVVGDFVLGPRIGTGSFAVVWKAEHRLYGYEVAIKEIDKNRVNTKIERGLLKEIAILSRISHPNIVRLYQAIQTEDRIFLVLEYCSGGDLSGYIKRYGKQGRVSDNSARYLMRQLAEGMKVLREHNLIHRDLKPQNLLLSTADETPTLKIGDFGFARYLKPQGLADTLCGSPLYMAPEIIRDRKYDAKADLWSVGAILFQLVTGKPPFDGNSHIQLFQNIMASNELPFPRNVLIHLHSDCIDLCKSLLRRNPVERLTFEEFFNHNFLAIHRPSSRASGIDKEPRDHSDAKLEYGGLSNSSGVTNSNIGSLFSYTETTRVADSLENIEQEYVLVHANFASLETISCSLETSTSSKHEAMFPSYVTDFVKKGTEKPELAMSYVHGTDDIGCVSPHHDSAKFPLLVQYMSALKNLAEEKLSAGLLLESFSLQLVILAVWREVLQACSLTMDATKENSDLCLPTVSGHFSQQGDLLIPNSSEDLNQISSLPTSSLVEREFVDACIRAEEIAKSLRGNENMPDPMEIIFQVALSAGKSGAVDEVVHNWTSAVASYRKAIILLMFIMDEAKSLRLKPPFSLSLHGQQRIQEYIVQLTKRLEKSQMAVLQQKNLSE